MLLSHHLQIFQNNLVLKNLQKCGSITYGNVRVKLQSLNKVFKKAYFLRFLHSGYVCLPNFSYTSCLLTPSFHFMFCFICHHSIFVKLSLETALKARNLEIAGFSKTGISHVFWLILQVWSVSTVLIRVYRKM